MPVVLEWASREQKPRRVGEYVGVDSEDRDEYKAENVFFVPAKARWSYLQARAKLPEIGKDVDDAMDAIEKENPSLKRGFALKVHPAPKVSLNHGFGAKPRDIYFDD
jgi:type I restriction-modification system DNA methylase subunit